MALCSQEQACVIKGDKAQCDSTFPLPPGEHVIKARFSAATQRKIHQWLKETPKQEVSARFCVKLQGRHSTRHYLGTIEATRHASGGGNAVVLPEGWFVMHTHPNVCNSSECDIEQPSAQDIKIALGDFNAGRTLAHYIISRNHIYRLSFAPRVQGNPRAAEAIVQHAEKIEHKAIQKFKDTGEGKPMQQVGLMGLRRLKELGCTVRKFPLAQLSTIEETISVVVGGGHPAARMHRMVV